MMKPAMMAIISILFCLLLFSCNDSNDTKETLFRGTARIACDEEIIALIAPQIEAFVSKHDGANVLLDTTTALDAMRSLLTGHARAAVVARDYLPVEDSLMRAHSIEPHKRFTIATDALVFAVTNQSALDTISSDVLIRTLAGNRTYLSQYRWAVPMMTSSITAQLSAYAGGQLRIAAHRCRNADSVAGLLQRRTADIGVLLLSQFNRLKDRAGLRSIRVIISDTATGDRIAVAPHAATIVKGRYPFPVPIYGYLLETARNFPYGVIASIAQEPQSQRAMLQAGIVPAYAKLQLVEQE